MAHPFLVVDCDQRSDEWRMARLGRLGGSDAKHVIDVLKNGREGAKRRDLRYRLVAERLTGRPQEDGFVNAEMQRGVDLEPMARAMYEALTGRLVQTVGYLQHPFLMAGCSLDGYAEDFAGIVEFKCPKSATHVTYLRGRQLPADYVPQVAHNLWITGAAWCDFMSFDDRLPDHLQRFLVRVTAADVDVPGYAKKAEAFLAECDALASELAGLAVA